jgi:hypothetical protein
MSDTQTTPRKRTVKKAAAPSPPIDQLLDKVGPKVVAKPSMIARFYEPVYLYRFLFANGDVVDIHAMRDDSVLRDALITHRKVHGDRIIGATRLGFEGYADMEHYVEV